MKIHLIAAVARNGVIGKDGGQPFDIPEDWQLFLRTTRGKIVIMGSKTYPTMPSAAENEWRKIVITRSGTAYADAMAKHSLEEALTYCREQQSKEIFIIGGQHLFDAAIRMADVLHLTRIEQDIEGDRYFPAIDPEVWKEAEQGELKITADGRFRYRFTRWERKPLMPSV